MHEHLLQHWKKYIHLPEGFFLEISGEGSNTKLNVRYNGRGFRNIVQPGGEKPDLEDDSAYVGSVSLEETGAKIIGFVTRIVLEAQEKIKQPVNAQ